MREFLDLAHNFRSTAVVDDEFPSIKHRFDSQLNYLRSNLPKIVCLCGSTRFYNEFIRANYEETMRGNIVLSVGFFIHSLEQIHGEKAGCTPEQKIKLDELHKRKIDLADEILVINIGGYIGDSTKSEIAYAIVNRKVIRFFENPKGLMNEKGEFDENGD